MSELHDQRLAAAEDAYQAHEFGGIVDSDNGWETIPDEPDKMYCVVFMDYEDGGDTTKDVFYVRFEPETANVAECWTRN